ncbi:hypothetical protein DFS34DRAFT_590193 [Phlyctochytrium arcticum]|nr:hypothetical protein DFS34DRAFT_590193 [Phlyctochytrium arcticum]
MYVRQLAAKNVAGLTTSPEFLPFFKENNFAVIKDLAQLISGEPLAAHDALSALINLSTDNAFVPPMSDEAFLFNLILMIVLPKNVVADLCCMLLSNLSESNVVARKLVEDLAEGGKKTEGSSESKNLIRTQYISNLLDIYVRGEGRVYNKNADFNFLGGVLVNVAKTPAGAAWFRGRETPEGMLRLSKMVPFIEHPNRARRAAAIATVKNTAFDTNGHSLLLTDEELNLLPYLLLPLSGPDDYTDELIDLSERVFQEMDGMPDELQLLESDKKREPDAKLRKELIEILLLFTTTKQGRIILRQKKVYPVVQKLHVNEPDDAVQEAIEKLVQLLCREESTFAEIESAPSTAGTTKSKDYTIGEIDSDSDEDEEVNMGSLI